MQYISTRGEAPPLSFSGALMAGLARDGGLYVPKNWPVLSKAEIAALAGKPFAEVAVTILTPFVGDDIPQDVLRRAAEEAYATFGHTAVTPLVQIAPNDFVLELFHGPTLAFKDVAMQLVARLMDYVLEKMDSRSTIVCATSGDTGGAAAEAFRGRARADMVILFPKGRVSDVQRRMMTTPTEGNIHPIEIDGTFDDCQAIVKALFNNHSFRDSVQLAGVNSINWGRIVAQVTYFFVAAIALGAPERSINFAVPTGNFGDIFAGYVAKKMGLPIETLVIATNVNDILARTMETGNYEVRSVAATTSPSMDIQVSSNFERLLFEESGRDAVAVRGMMANLSQSGRFTVPEATLGALRQTFDAKSIDEDVVALTMRAMHAKSAYLADPHTAIAIAAAGRIRRNSATPMVMLATAHPAKFPDTVKDVTGEHAALPKRLAHLMTDGERIKSLPNDARAVEAYICSSIETAA